MGSGITWRVEKVEPLGVKCIQVSIPSLVSLFEGELGMC